MQPCSPFRGCVFIVLGGCKINGSIKLWGNCNGEPYLSSLRLRCSCPEIKGPWLNWHHAVLLVPTVAATVATPSLTDWVNSWPPQRIRKSNPLSLKMELFSRTMHSRLFQRSTIPGHVSFSSQVPSTNQFYRKRSSPFVCGPNLWWCGLHRGHVDHSTTTPAMVFVPLHLPNNRLPFLFLLGLVHVHRRCPRHLHLACTCRAHPHHLNISTLIHPLA